MSRVGKKPVNVPGSVKVKIEGDTVFVEGPKGKLGHKIPAGLKVSLKNNKLLVEKIISIDERMPVHGLTRSILSNLVKGVTEGYTKNLEIRGVGFKAQAQGNTLQMTLGFSHPIKYAVQEGVTVTTPKPVQVIVTGADKVKVGEVAAEIRDYFRAEPYTGKGIRYVGEYVRHKAGKTIVK